MYFNNLKKLRNNHELTQKAISQKLNCNRSTYNNWEHNIVMLPIEIADKLSIIYNVRLSHILGIDKTPYPSYKIKAMDYNKLLENLSKLKQQNKHTFENIASYLKCNRSTCQRYFKGTFKIPIDRLILLSELYKVDIDKLCGKE